MEAFEIESYPVEFVEIPVEAIVNGEVVEVTTKSIPIQKVHIE